MLFWYSIHKTWGAISIWVELGLVSLNLGVVSALKFLKNAVKYQSCGCLCPISVVLNNTGNMLIEAVVIRIDGFEIICI